jgi:hypothetical protein
MYIIIVAAERRPCLLQSRATVVYRCMYVKKINMRIHANRPPATFINGSGWIRHIRPGEKSVKEDLMSIII